MNQQIADIKYPETNVYYENNSADGFAFLGIAQAKLRLEYQNNRENIRQRRFRLNSPQRIRKIRVSKDNWYVYTLWPCLEFLYLIGDYDKIDELMDIVDQIGIYPSGMFRYCSEEIYYLVPNATSCAALLYAMQGNIDKVKILLNILQENQLEDGNWAYYDLNKDFSLNQKARIEDCYHIAMMTVHLREIKKLTGIDTNNIVEKTVAWLARGDGKRCRACGRLPGPLCPGRIGWGVPMYYLALNGIHDRFASIAYKKTVEYLLHSNFRVRAISAWALAKGLEV